MFLDKQSPSFHSSPPHLVLRSYIFIIGDFMKKIIALTFLFSLIAIAPAYASAVDGKMVYKLPNGELVSRAVTLEVPSRGQGEVILRGQKFEWKTTKFWTVKKAGQTSFIAVFKTKFRNFKSLIALRGTYLKGTNKILYYGDTYKKSGHKLDQESLAGFTYSGGFKFEHDL